MAREFMTKAGVYDTDVLRKKLKIMNIIMAALAIAAIVCYILFPFFSVNVFYKLDSEKMQEIMGDTVSDEGELPVDMNEIVGDGIDIKLGISLTPKMFLTAWTEKDSDAYVQKQVLDFNIKSILKDLEPVLNKVLNNAVKSVAKSAVTEAIKESLPADSDTAKVLKEAGLDQAVDNIIDKFNEDNVTVDDFVDTIAEEVTNVYNKLQENGVIEEAGAMTPEEITELKETMTEMFNELGLVEEDGTIKDIQSAMAAIMDKIAGETNNDADSDKTAGASEEDMVSGDEDMVSGDEDASSELSEKLSNIIKEKIPADVASKLAGMMKYVGIALGVFVFFWLYIALSCIIKLFAKKRVAVFTGFFFVFFAIIQILLGLGLTFGVDFLLSGKVNIPAVKDFIRDLDGMNLHIGTSMMWSSFFLLGKFVLSWFYLPAKRKLKRA